MNTLEKNSTFSYSSLEWDKIIEMLRNKTSSEPGRSIVDSLEPSADPSYIEFQLCVNSECKRIVMSSIRYPIQGYTDISKQLKALGIAEMPLNAEEINEVVINLETALRMRSVADKIDDGFPEITSLIKKLKTHSGLVNSVRKKIDETGSILDGASPTLKRIRRQISQKKDQLRNRANELMKKYADSGLLRESHVTLRNGRYVLPVKDSSLRQVQGVTHDVSSSGATIFIEPLEVVERSNVIARLTVEEQEEIRKILSEITASLRKIADDIAGNQDLLAILDYHYACGQLAFNLNANRPILNREKKLILRGARHPLLLSKVGGPDRVIPLSVTIGEKFRTLIISGPNAGGKTVSLKTVGLLCLMVQCGLLVPADEDSEFPVFKRIIAEIGDSQSIENDLSTFSAKLIGIKDIIENLSSDDLILMDELGTGTDPQEGVGLAIAIIDYLTQREVFTIATTHHGGLKLYANDADNVENASLAFDEKSFKPSYILSTGVPGSSYALELSKRIGLPEEILEKSRQLVGSSQLRIEEMIRELERNISDIREKNINVSNRQKNLDGLICEYEEKLSKVQKDYYKKLEETVDSSEKNVEDFNRKLEHVIKEIKEQSASREAIKKAKEVVEEEKKRIRNTRTEHKKIVKKIQKREKPVKYSEKDIKVGSTVQIKGYEQSGIVVSENLKKKSVTVQMATVKMDVKKDRVIPVKTSSKQTVRVSGAVSRTFVRPEIDLRGMQADDALSAVDQYLFDAVNEGFSEVRIIHGKGSGILRNNVTEMLKNDDRIVDFRLGNWGEGDTGVTVAKLKSN